MNRAEKIQHAKLLEEKIRRNKENMLARIYESFYEWQMKFVAATKDYTVAALLGGNRVGKTRTGLVVSAYHLRGDYPDNWPGATFDFAPLCWLLGYSGEKTRDLLQYKLFGRYANGIFEGGLIPANRIVSNISMQGTSGAMREVRVKHVNGIATCQFWSYTQGQSALMGDNVDFFQIDEEPEKQDIFPQVITRTLTGNRGKGGSGILTLTPEYGKTQLVCKLMGEASEIEDDDEAIDVKTNSMYLQTATWNQCPHIDDDAKRKLLSIYPKHQRRMRSEGVPLFGSGLIFDIDENDISCDPFDVPDYWFVINGLDFGWNHPQSCVQLVWDRDTDTFYLINAWKASMKQPFEAWHIVKPWAQNVPTAWPHDGYSHKQQAQGEAKELKALYVEAGFSMLPNHSTWEEGGFAVWPAITQILSLMREGRFKIVRTLFDVFEELRQYHTKTVSNNKTGAGGTEIVKVKDDLIDGIFKAYIMRRHAIRVMDLYPKAAQRKTRKKRQGY